MSVEQINRVCREEISTRRIEKKGGERNRRADVCIYKWAYRLCWTTTTTKACWSAQHTHGRGKIQRRWPGCYYSSLGSPFLLIRKPVERLLWQPGWNPCWIHGWAVYSPSAGHSRFLFRRGRYISNMVSSSIFCSAPSSQRTASSSKHQKPKGTVTFSFLFSLSLI